VSIELARTWRTRIAEIATEKAREYDARLFAVNGVSVFAVPLADEYAIMLHWPDHDHEVSVTFDAEALAIADDATPDALSALISARIAYEVGRYFATRAAPWRPADAR